MTPSIKGTLAAGLAAATILSGLSFGPAAASAAPAKSPKASTSATVQLVFAQSDGKFRSPAAVGDAGSNGTGYFEDSTLAAALARARSFTVIPEANGYYSLKSGTNCLVEQSNRYTLVNDCSGSSVTSSKWKYVDGYLQNQRGTRIADAVRDSPSSATLHTSADGQRLVSDPGALLPTTALTASVTSVNHVAKTAVIGGTATKGATIEVHGQTVTANATTGAWSMPLTGLSNGSNGRIVRQLIGGAEHDRKTVDINVITNGGVTGTANGPITISRTGDVPVVAGVTVTASRFTTMRDTTMVFTAPAGTTFKAGQTTLAGQYKHAGQDWSANSAFLQLQNGVRSADGKTLTFTNTTSWGGADFNKDAQIRWSPVLNLTSGAGAATGTLGFTFSGSSNNGAFSTTGSTSTVINAALTATVTSVDNVAKTAVIGGTATKGATIEVHGQTVTANATTGAWTMNLTGLSNGSNGRIVRQLIGGAEYDRKTLDITVLANGAVDPSAFSAVTLGRGSDTNVQYGITTKADGFTKLQGSVVLTAPTGTTFKTGQTTLQGQFRHTGQTNWTTSPSLTLTGGTLSNSNRTLTFQIDTPTMSLSNNSEVRWGAQVSTPAAAAEGTGTLGFTFEGTSNKGTYRAQGSTPTVLNAALTATVTSVDNVAKTAVIGGTATKGAKIKVGTQEVTAHATTGAWTMNLTGLANGDNSRKVEQFIGSTKVDDKDLTITVIVNGGLVGTANGPITLSRTGDTSVVAGVTVSANEFHTVRDTTMVFTAPTGTTFKAGQTTLAGQYKQPGSGWSGNHAFIQLKNGVLSNDNRTLTFTNTDSWASTNFDKDAQMRWSPVLNVTSGAAANDGSLGFTFSGTSNNGTFRVAGSTSTTLQAAMTAEVRKVNNIAKSAVIGGVAAPGATVKVGTQEVTANATTGVWEMTVTGLAVGAQNRTVEQFIGSQKTDQATVAITIGENGTIIPGTSPATEITAGETKSVQVLATANGKVELPEGTITFTAPEGTTFPAGQNTINGQFQQDGSGSWSGTGMQLTGGVRSADGKTYTYNWKTSTGSPTWAVNDKSNFRWSINVAANADATTTSTSLGFVLAGDAKQGDFRAQGSTAVNVVADDVRPITVRVDSVDSDARSARVSGNATPNSEIRVGTSVIGTANASGAWSGTVTGLTVGANDVLFEQFIRNEKANDVRQVINVAEQVVPFTVTAPVHESTIVAPDRQVTFRGTGQPGGKVSIMYGERVVGTVDSIPANGEWNFTATMNYFDYEMTVFYKKSATGGLTSQQPLNVNVTSGVANRPFEIVTPTNNSTIGAPDKQVTFSGNGTPGARVSIMHGARNIGSETVGAAGTWSFTATMNYAEYDLTAYYKRTPSSDVYQVPLKITVNAGETGFAIGTPAEGGTVTAGTFNVAGTGKVGSRVSVFLNGSSRGSATTNAAGDWTIPVTVNTPGTYTFDVYYKANPTSDYADLVPLTLTVIR